MGHVVIRNEQAVFVGGGIGVSCTIQRISVHRPHVGEGHIVQGAVCLGAAVKGAVHRAGNAHAGEVKIISATGARVNCSSTGFSTVSAMSVKLLA